MVKGVKPTVHYQQDRALQFKFGHAMQVELTT